LIYADERCQDNPRNQQQTGTATTTTTPHHAASIVQYVQINVAIYWSPTALRQALAA